MKNLTKNKKLTVKKKANAIVDAEVPNYEKHPFFIRKANEAKALIEAVGLPQELHKEE